MTGLLRKVLFLLLVLAMPAGPVQASDDAISTRAERLMAVYVYNFTRYTTWPGEDPGHTGTRLAVLGRNPFGSAMDEVAARSPAESRLQISYCGDLACARDSDAVFIEGGHMNASSIRQMLEALAGKPVLTISDQPGFARMGGMIELVRDKGKLAFRVNVGAAGRERLHISAQLLQLGEVVGEVVGGRP